MSRIIKEWDYLESISSYNEVATAMRKTIDAVKGGNNG